MASVPVYCICRQVYDVTRFMIECDICKDWFHGSCIGISEHQAHDVEVYHCPICSKIHGPLKLKPRRNWHRHDYSEVDASTRAVQTGTVVFLKELQNRTFPSADQCLIRLHGSQVTIDYFENHGFSKPILIDSKDGLGLAVPPPNFSVSDVESCVGSMKEVHVIDVSRQEEFKMVMKDWGQYFNTPVRSKVYNVISLEFSETKLSEIVIAPTVVRQLCWVSNLWPDQLPDDCPYTKPQVQKYCLMGVKDSYTDFHVDFGGTSVWYHVLRGEKVFYLIEPTTSNLALYESWVSSAQQSEMFFGDQVNECYKLVLKQGQTLFIPTGWIHAVYTPVDTMVFGGNFLHHFNIGLQIQIHELEKRVKTPERFQFPWFETTMWYAAKHFQDLFKDFREDEKKPASYLLDGVKALCSALRSWTMKKEYLKQHQHEIPETIQYSSLIKELSRELKQFDQKTTGKKKEKKKGKKKTAPSPKQQMDLNILHQHTQEKLQQVSEEMSHHLSLRLSPDVLSNEVKLPLTQQLSHRLPAQVVAPRVHEQAYHAIPQEQKPSIKVRIPKPGALTEEKKEEKDVDNQMSSGLKLVLSNGKIVSRSGSPKLKKEKLGGFQPLVSTTGSELESSDNDEIIVDDEPQQKSKPGSLKLKLSFNGKPVVPNDNQASAVSTSQDSSFLSSSLEDFTAVATTTMTTTTGIEQSDSGEDLMPSERSPRGPPPPYPGTASNKIGSIDDLLVASQYDLPPPPAASMTILEIEEELKNQPASPSTHEAIQGMLSIGLPKTTTDSEVPVQPHSTALSSFMSLPARLAFEERAKPKEKRIYADLEDNPDSLPTCFQDSKYVYPTLDEDEGPLFKSRSKKPRRDPADAPWNPKAKLVASCPKPDRPVRDAAKKPNVESGLAEAAARLANQPRPKRQYIRKKPVEKPATPEPIPGPSTSGLNLSHSMGSSAFRPPLNTGGISLSSSAPGSFLKDAMRDKDQSAAAKSKKPKKGMATAKQRLSKILKLQKGGRLIL
ncbi:histone lysine demethylase PHF8-like isoform X2 [Ptychodera flava]|uniref:histone lysine demethylase PHF8-like isoform X2 n=1 Tax=Ptychodera flava TaxID=63121 RepID=UPI00396A0A87